MEPARSATPGFLPRLAPPPRHVPLSLRLRALLGGGLGFFGWLWLAMGIGFSAAFLGKADLTSWARFRGPLEVVEGTSLGCEDTGASEGGSKNRRGIPIYAIRYAITVDGREHTGVSYSRGACIPEGHAVVVQHLPGRPEFSRIAGMRRGVFGPAVLLVAIFPLLGLGFVTVGFVLGRRTLRLLEHGRVAQGKLLSTEGTNVSVNKRQVMKLRFELVTDQGARHEVFVKSSVPERAQDDPTERLLYDPERPERAAAWDLLSPPPRTDPSGQLEGAGVRAVLVALLGPALAGGAIVAAAALL